jgi:hypothetical protein
MYIFQSIQDEIEIPYRPFLYSCSPSSKRQKRQNFQVLLIFANKNDNNIFISHQIPLNGSPQGGTMAVPIPIKRNDI